MSRKYMHTPGAQMLKSMYMIDPCMGDLMDLETCGRRPRVVELVMSPCQI